MSASRSASHPNQGRRAVLVTRHRKEEVIKRPLRDAVGLGVCAVPPELKRPPGNVHRRDRTPRQSARGNPAQGAAGDERYRFKPGRGTRAASVLTRTFGPGGNDGNGRRAAEKVRRMTMADGHSDTGEPGRSLRQVNVGEPTDVRVGGGIADIQPLAAGGVPPRGGLHPRQSLPGEVSPAKAIRTLKWLPSRGWRRPSADRARHGADCEWRPAARA